jgi:uracil-DNA glycosylase family 4
MPAISNIYVPDDGPNNARIMCVGESPGGEEEAKLKPFVGPSGDLLIQTLGRYGVGRGEVKLSNISHYRPAGNKFEILFNTPQLAKGLQELERTVLEVRPNVIAALGGMPLYYLTGKSKKITFWRGSILPCIWDETIKVIPTFHPSFVLRDRSNFPTFDLDIKRICEDSLFQEFKWPNRTYIIDPRGSELEEWTERLCQAQYLGTDIETTKKEKHLLCIGFAPSPDVGVCLVNHGDSHFIQCVQRILSSNAKKIFHFGTFDTEVLHLKGFEVNEYYWDTLVGQHILAPELPRGLDYLSSVYTREPYYKSTGRNEIPGDNKEWGEKFDRKALYEYNAKDCCVTIEIALQQMQELKGRNLEMFHYEMSLIPVGQMMSRNGMLIDVERRDLFKMGLLMRWKTLQVLIDMIMKEHVNVQSPFLHKILYGKLGLPVRKTREGKVTTDEDAVVATLTYILDYKSKLSRADAVAAWELKYTVCKTILEIRGIRKLLSSYILNSISSDNRARSTYKFSNTDTGRSAAEKYIDGTGLNSQTFPRGYVNVPDELIEIPEHITKELEEDVKMELDFEEHDSGVESETDLEDSHIKT